MTLRVGIIGPGRHHNGTGEYVAKYLHAEGALVAGIVASSPESAKQHAATLNAKYGINASAYADTETLLKEAPLDAIAICTPAELHEKDLRLALKYKKHAFCEKPLVWGDATDLARTTDEITKNFYSSNLVLHYNVQWTYALKYYKELYGDIDAGNVSSFRMELSPSKPEPVFMIKEAAPHANSLLLALGADGGIKDLRLEYDKKSSRMRINYLCKGARQQDIRIENVFNYMETQPRHAAFAINGNTVLRELEMPSYKIFFSGNGKKVEASDPLLDSIKDFVVKTGSKAKEETLITRNMKILKLIYEAYRATPWHS